MRVHQNVMEFVKKVGVFRETISEDIRPTWLKLTTITLVSSHLKDTGNKIDLDVLRRVFKKMRYIPINRNNSDPFMWRMFYSSFYNQVTIGYTDSLSTKKVKVFPNGSLQIAGCRDMNDCKNFINQLRLIMDLIYNVDIPVDSFRIVMINSNFSLQHMIHQMNVVKIFNTKKFSISFDPDRYSAVKLKFTPVHGGKQVTVSIFSSGSVIITGAQTIDEVCEAYIAIVERMVAHHKLIFVSKMETTKDFETFMGYTYNDWFQKIMSDTGKNVDSSGHV